MIFKSNQLRNYLKKIAFSEKHDCWNWIGARNNDGYGIFGIKENKKLSLFLAHRISYDIFCEDIPNGLIMDHKCKNRSCVNPNHLRAVTYSENNKGRILKSKSLKPCAVKCTGVRVTA